MRNSSGDENEVSRSGVCALIKTLAKTNSHAAMNYEDGSLDFVGMRVPLPTRCKTTKCHAERTAPNEVCRYSPPSLETVTFLAKSINRRDDPKIWLDYGVHRGSFARLLNFSRIKLILKV